MLENKKIKTALVSVFHKDGLDEILKLLHAEGVNFISTGGTQSFSVTGFVAWVVSNSLILNALFRYPCPFVAIPCMVTDK